ncbi:hypothetical protein TNCV_3857811 [Trichonephila clavipes]|nr:hypothetical protein TNCV_3857811 [Trichonephila clavipes]
MWSSLATCEELGPASEMRGLDTARMGRATTSTVGSLYSWNCAVPPSREGTIHLQTSMPSPGFEPCGTADSFAKHNTGWPNLRISIQQKKR